MKKSNLSADDFLPLVNIRVPSDTVYYLAEAYKKFGSSKRAGTNYRVACNETCKILIKTCYELSKMQEKFFSIV